MHFLYYLMLGYFYIISCINAVVIFEFVVYLEGTYCVLHSYPSPPFMNEPI